MPSEPPYIAISRRKLAYQASQIPAQWLLPSDSPFLPQNRPEPTVDDLGAVWDVPRKCGALTKKELEITERWDCEGLVGEMVGGRLSARDVVEGFCKRAAIVHQLTNCLTEPLFHRALAHASDLDVRLRQTGQPIGPLHGLPVTVKDTFNIIGIDSSIGIASLCFKPANFTAPLVELLESLGAVVIAKTNVPQTLGAVDSVNNVFGRTMNPGNRLVTAGGSSGGEGVMVAMRGSMIGFGTDIGGSIRIPAMANGVVGVKPSPGRFPYGGQEQAGERGLGSVGVQASAGPIARGMKDASWVYKEVASKSSAWGSDCIPWTGAKEEERGCGEDGRWMIGVVKSDGNADPLPPVAKALEEVASKLKMDHKTRFEVVQVPTPDAFRKAGLLINKFFIIDGVGKTMDLLQENEEPTIPWLAGRLRKREPFKILDVERISAQREDLQDEMLKVWWSTTDGQARMRKLDAIICPVASHPVPAIDRWASVGYTSSFVLLDCAAGSLPVRMVRETDLELGKPLEGTPRGREEKATRVLWDERATDRRVYRGTPLSVQVVTPRLEEEKLLKVMEMMEAVIHFQPGAKEVRM